MNWIDAFFKWLGAGSPRKPNVTDECRPTVCVGAFRRIFLDGGKVQRFVWSPDHFIDCNPDNGVFREWSCGYHTPDNVWEMTPTELNDWFAHHRTADYVASDWIVVPKTND